MRYTTYPYTLGICLICCTASAAGQTVAHVDASATGANTGLAWRDAFTNLQDALSGEFDEVWVAGGVYRPAEPGGDRTAAFELVSGRALYGGFPPGGGAFEQRDPAAHETVLSGDLNADDAPGWVNTQPDNSYHVVTANEAGETAVLDGFTIRGGWAWQSTGSYSGGAGMYLTGGAPTIRRCTVTGNLAHSGAGAVVYTSSATFEDCDFVGNWAVDGCGGGIYAQGDYENEALYTLTVRRCRFLANEAQVGGGPGDAGAIWTSSRVVLEVSDTLFENNVARWRFDYGNFAASGGAIVNLGERATITNSVFRGNRAHNGGAIWNGRELTLVNCLFVENEAFRQSVNFYDYGGFGGAIYSMVAPVEVINCTLTANEARTTAGIFTAYSSDVQVRNSILWGNVATEEDAPVVDGQFQGSVTFSHSCVEGIFERLPGEDAPDPAAFDAVISMNPIWAGPEAGDYRLSAGSPCIDSGDNAFVPAGLAVGLDGNARFHDDPATPDKGAGAPPIVDMGAYEFGPWVDPGGNTPPVADFSFLVAGTSVQFADLSSDIDGEVVAWYWDFGDYGASDEANPAHQYHANGDFEAVLVVRDDKGATGRSETRTVTITDYAPADITLARPRAGDVVFNTVTLEARVSDPARLAEIKFYVDGVSIGKTSGAPYAIDWNTPGYADGPHGMRARLTDFDENEISSETVTVTVDNATARILSDPGALQANIGSPFTHIIEASGNPAPGFSLDTRPGGMNIDALSGQLSWTPGADQMGLNNVTVRAANATSFDTLTFQINAVDLEAPAAPPNAAVTEETQTGATLAWGEAQDNVGVAHYQLWKYAKINQFSGHWRLYIDNIADTNISVELDPGARYAHRFVVKAVDAAGNISPGSGEMSPRLHERPWLYHNPAGEVFTLTAGQEGTYTVSWGGYPAPVFSLVQAPAGLAVDSVTGLVSWTPQTQDAGNHIATIRGTNTAGFDDLEINIAVNPIAGEGEGEGEGNPCAAGPSHTADQNADNRIDLAELLRVIQFFNSGGFHCASTPGATEDGYTPGAGDNHGCCPHDSDYAGGRNWAVSLSELLRLIQFFNAGGYRHCPGQGTEDAFCTEAD